MPACSLIHLLGVQGKIVGNHGSPAQHITGLPIHPSKRQPQAEVFGEDSEVRSDFQTFLILTVLGKRFRSTPSTGKSPNYQGCLGREGLGSGGMGQLLHGTAALLSEALHGEVCGWNSLASGREWYRSPWFVGDWHWCDWTGSPWLWEKPHHLGHQDSGIAFKTLGAADVRRDWIKARVQTFQGVTGCRLAGQVTSCFITSMNIH